MQPGKLLLQTTGACDFDPEHMLDVFGRQRQRFVAVLQGFGPDDWAAPTRCTDWSAHDVIRHLCDNNIRAAAIDLDSRGGVTLTVTRATTAGPPAAGVADALAGRSPVAAALSDLPASSRGALSLMADFFNSPVGQSPA